MSIVRLELQCPRLRLYLFLMDRSFSIRNWVAGAAGSAAAVTALTPMADARTVQISLGTGATSILGGLASNTIQADLTGDGKADLKGVDIDVQYETVGVGPSSFISRLRFYTSSRFLAAVQYRDPVPTSLPYSYRVYINGTGGTTHSGFTNRLDLSDLVLVTFHDKRINGGKPTDGFLEINGENLNNSSQSIQLVRLIFDDASTARPSGVAPGGTDAEWVDPTPRLRSKLKRQIRATKKKLRNARRAGKKAAVRRLKKRLRMAKKELRQLC